MSARLFSPHRKCPAVKHGGHEKTAYVFVSGSEQIVVENWEYVAERLSVDDELVQNIVDGVECDAFIVCPVATYNTVGVWEYTNIQNAIIIGKFISLAHII